MTIAPFVQALIECDFSAEEFVRHLRNKLPAEYVADLDELLKIAPADKAVEVVRTFVLNVLDDDDTL